MMETEKAQKRRIQEGFFEKYCRGKGIDIGYGSYLLVENCRGWEIDDGDAQYMIGVPDEEYDFVYSSHTLEHLYDPLTALQNWWRILKPGGYLILFLPHRDLFEKKRMLPSLYNLDHKHFFLIDHDEAPDTRGILPLIHRALTGYRLLYAKECSEGHTITDPLQHSDGEFSIEVVLKKEKLMPYSN
jgi:SAM-dependent methyltransferase